MVKDAISESVKTIQFLSRQVDMGVLVMEAAKKNLEAKEAALSGDGAFTEEEHMDIQRMSKTMKRKMGPANMYEVNKDLAKRVINDDRFTRDGGRIMVDVPGEAPVTDMMM